MTDKTVTATPDASADPDAAKYDELRKELGLDETGEPVAEPAAAEPAVPASEPEPQAESVSRVEHENVQKALREAREAQRASDERLRGIMQLVQESRTKREPEPKKDEPKLPAKEEDPIGYFEGRIAQLEAEVREARTGGQHTTEQLQAWQQQQAIRNAVVASEQDILDTKSQNHKADYWDACAHLEGARIGQLDTMYPEDSPYAQALAQQQGYRSVQDLKIAQLNADRQAVAIQALQMGVSPAQLYYNLAVKNGYQPKAAGKANGDGKDLSLAEKAKQALEATKKGKAASVSVSGSNSGRKGADDMALADLADLFIEDPEMADKIWDQMARAGKLG